MLTNRKSAYPLDAGGFTIALGRDFYHVLQGHVVSALRARPTLKHMRPVCPAARQVTPYGRAGRSCFLRVGRAPTASDVTGQAPPLTARCLGSSIAWAIVCKWLPPAPLRLR